MPHLLNIRCGKMNGNASANRSQEQDLLPRGNKYDLFPPREKNWIILNTVASSYNGRSCGVGTATHKPGPFAEVVQSNKNASSTLQAEVKATHQAIRIAKDRNWRRISWLPKFLASRQITRGDRFPSR